MADGSEIIFPGQRRGTRSWIFLWMLLLFGAPTEQTGLNITFNKSYNFTFPDKTLKTFLECLCFNGAETCTFTYNRVDLSTDKKKYYFNVSSVLAFSSRFSLAHPLSYICDRPTFTEGPENIPCHRNDSCSGSSCSDFHHFEEINSTCPCINIQWKYNQNLTYIGTCAPKQGLCSDSNTYGVIGSTCPIQAPQSTPVSPADPYLTSTITRNTLPTTSDTASHSTPETRLSTTGRPELSTQPDNQASQGTSSDNQAVIIGAGLGSALGIVVIAAGIALFFVWRRKQPPEQPVNKDLKVQPNLYSKTQEPSNDNIVTAESSHGEDDYGYTDYVQPGSMYYEIDGDGELTAIRDEQFDRKKTSHETGKSKEPDGTTGPEDDGYNKLNTKNGILSTTLATYNKAANRFVDRLPDKRPPKEDSTYSMARPISSEAAAHDGGCRNLSATSPDTSHKSETDYFELEAVKDEDGGDEIDMKTNSILEDSDHKNDYFQLESAEDEDDGGWMESEDSIMGNSETVSDPKNDYFQLESVEEQDKSD